MKKYIDAEKLIAEIEFAKSVYSSSNRVVYGIADAFRQDGRAAMCDDILKKIDSLKQEQSDDICQEINKYYGKNIPFEDERSKAAYHFFSSGRSFELKQIEEREKQHITDLLDNYKKGMKAGYRKAISSIKNYKKEEKRLLYKPKQWALYCNDKFISSYPSHNSAKAALHRKCEEMKKYPYDYEGEYYTIKPYNHDQRRRTTCIERTMR